MPLNQTIETAMEHETKIADDLAELGLDRLRNRSPISGSAPNFNPTQLGQN